MSAGGAGELGHVALDGTKVKANASNELPTAKKAAQLPAPMRPQELAFREGRLEKIREAMAALEAEAQAAAEQAEAEGGNRPGGARRQGPA